MQLIHEKNAEQGKPPTPRADLRFGTGPDGHVFLLNKHDGMIRMLVPDDYVREGRRNNGGLAREPIARSALGRFNGDGG